MEIYVKGAPEVMPDICDPASCMSISWEKQEREERADMLVPNDYEDMLSYYTRNGFRVIAIAGKSVEGMTWLRAQRMRR